MLEILAMVYLNNSHIRDINNKTEIKFFRKILKTVVLFSITVTDAQTKLTRTENLQGLFYKSML